MMKGTNAKANLFIVILLVIIIVAGIILSLKIFGVIKPSEKESTINNDVYVAEEDNNDRENVYSYDDYEDTEPIVKRGTVGGSIALNVILIIIVFVLSLGTSKLYRKLELPNYIVTFTLIYPLLSIIANWTNGWLKTIIEFIFAILGILSMYHYFKAVEMPGFLSILLFAAGFILPIGISKLFTASLFGGRPWLGALITVVGIVMILAWIIAYIISNKKLGEMFNKSLPFTVGLCILPFIFQPILGFSRDEK